jgi:uncharacterized membrane protein YbhN (UPF0104 family)
VLAGLGVLGLVVLAIPSSRRLIRARAAPMLGQVLPRLLQVAQQPRKLAQGIGGALLLSAAYILCLAACVAAFSRSVPIASIAVVYLTSSAFGSIMPTPGGLGAVELALTAGLTAAGLPSAVAGSSVLLFRLLTFWLPVPAGWVALSYLERKQVLLAAAVPPCGAWSYRASACTAVLLAGTIRITRRRPARSASYWRSTGSPWCTEARRWG